MKSHLNSFLHTTRCVSLDEVSYNGDMDFCIAIRTIVLHNQIAYIQGGAGIVADSNPEKEYLETLDKVSALKSTLEIAR